MTRSIEAEWISALRRAADRHPAPGSPVFFREEREDLRAESDGRETVTHTRWAGLSVRAAPPERGLVYLTDPVPDDLPALASAFRAGGPPRVPRGRRTGPVAPWLDAGEALLGVRETVARIADRHPKAAIRARWVSFEQRVQIARAGRQVALDVRKGCRLRVEVRVEDAGGAGHAVAEADLRHRGAEIESVVERVCSRIEWRLGARPARSGETVVVLAAGAGGVWAHEAVGHALEGDTALDGRSALARAHRAGGIVAVRELTVMDDPRRGRAAWRRDDEGESARPTALVRDGRVTGLLHDLRSAGRAGVESSGHGRCASFRDPVVPRMGCTFVANGPHSREELLRDVGHGVLVHRMEAASTEPSVGRAVFRVTDGDLVEGGRPTVPLRGFVLELDTMKTLAAIRGIADDLRFDTCIGSCHRDGQTLPISVGAPTICIGVATVRS